MAELKRRENSRASDSLTFAFAPDGFTSATLPFALNTREGSQTNTGALPFAFGTSKPDTQPPPISKIGRYLIGAIEPTLTVANCQSSQTRSLPVAQCHAMDYGVTITVSNCQSSLAERLPPLRNCHGATSAPVVTVEGCHFGRFVDVNPLANCATEDGEAVVPIADCTMGSQPKPIHLKRCEAGDTLPVQPLVNCHAEAGLAMALLRCFGGDTVPSVRVPCEWYTIELPPVKPPYEWPCGEPPPSDRQPLSFVRPESNGRDGDLLPMPFACHYTPEPTRRRTYMIYNTVTAEIDGQPIGIYSAKISTAMSAFCWQFDVEIRHDDFAKLNLESRTDDPLLTLTINGHQWVMLVEDYGERKSFNRDSYTLTGRSRTALLSGDHAKRKTQLVTSALNASQLAQQQLVGTGFSLVYDSDADWFIPANTYTVSGTPIETIMDIAEAGGHYVASHPTDKKLFIRKCWPRPAWEINSSTADRQLSALTWLSLTGNRKVSTRYNSVRLSGSGANAKGGHIFRQVTAGDKTPEASAVNHVLYAGDANNTPVNALRNKGIQILSDSGKHKIYSVESLWADDPTNPESIKLAKQQEVIDIMDVSGRLGRGVVTGVSIDVGENNRATEITQTNVIDVYLDE